jgi:hypothetical protein
MGVAGGFVKRRFLKARAFATPILGFVTEPLNYRQIVISP